MPSALCHIREGNNNNMEGNQSYPSLPAVSSDLLLPFLPTMQSSQRVHVSKQRLADSGPEEEKRGERSL